MKFFSAAVVILLSVMGSLSEARVFNINNEEFAAYVRGTYFPTAIENTAFSGSNGAGTTVDDEFKYNVSGEFGFTYATPAMNFRFGFEVIRPAAIKATGTNGSGTALYDVKADASVFAPKLGLELNLKKWNQARFFMNLAAGAATLTARNAYSFTAAGNTAFSVTDYAEDLRSTAILYDGSLGMETLMSDTTTFSLEAGYRMLNFKQIKHNKDNTIIGSGAVSKGDVAKNADGTDRKLDLSGLYIGAMFRFWLF